MNYRLGGSNWCKALEISSWLVSFPINDCFLLASCHIDIGLNVSIEEITSILFFSF